MGVHRVATRFTNVFQLWKKYELLLAFRESDRTQRLMPLVPSTPFCMAVTEKAILIDALSFLFTSYNHVQGLNTMDSSPGVPTNVALRRILLPDYEPFVLHLESVLSAMTKATGGASIIFYFDGETLSGSEVAIQQKANTQESRKVGTMQRILEMAGHLSGELQIDKKDVHFVSDKIVWCAEEALREIALRLPNVQIFNCLGEADPYLAHDGQFAALVVSDDTDFVMTPGILVSPIKGILLTEEGTFFQTRGIPVVASELGLSDFGLSHVAELVSFIGNDYTKGLLEDLVDREATSSPTVSTIQEWLLDLAQSIDTRGKYLGSERALTIDRLVPLVESEATLSYIMKFIHEKHFDLYEAIEFTREAILRPGVVVQKTIEESEKPDTTFFDISALPRGVSIIGYSYGIIAGDICAEDFSESIPSIAEVVLPLSATLVAELSEPQNEKEKEKEKELVVFWTHRVGINIVEDERLPLLDLLHPSYPLGRVSTSRDECLSKKILETLLWLCPDPVASARTDIMELKYDDQEFFTAFLLAFVTALSSQAKDVLSYREVSALSSMMGVMLALQGFPEERAAFLTSVTEKCDSKFLHDEPIEHGFSHMSNGFRDVTLCSRFLTVMSQLRTLCVLCNTLLGGGKNPGGLFHGPLFSMLLLSFENYDEIKSTDFTCGFLLGHLKSFLSSLWETESTSNKFIESCLSHTSNLVEFLQVSGCRFGNQSKQAIPKDINQKLLTEIFDDTLVGASDDLDLEQHSNELPVVKYRSTILETVRENPVVVIEADTGAGKRYFE